MPQITHAYSNDFVVGQDATITAATQLPDVPAKRVLLKAAPGPVYVGPDNTVSATTGFEVATGETIELFVGNLDAIWVIGGGAGEAVSWLVQR